MPAQLPTDPDTQAMGATITPDKSGVVFRCWAPRANSVWVVGDFNGWQLSEAAKLNARGEYWIGFFPGVRPGARYKFRTDGKLPDIGWKRDPYARELTKAPPHPRSECVVVDPAGYPWREDGYQPPDFSDLIVYQLHVGTFNGPDRANRPAKFLDVLGKLDYLVALGVNAVLFLPIVEFMSERSLGYEGADIFSPEQDYCVDEAEAVHYLPLVNGLRARMGLAQVDASFLASHCNQLKVVIEICHLHRVAVLFDVVYNHVNKDVPGPNGVESIWNFEQWNITRDHESYMFSDQDYNGPCWDIDWKVAARQYLIDNAGFFLREYHVDGFRYDEVSAIVRTNPTYGWRFCQDITRTVRHINPKAIQIAEYWSPGPDPWVVGTEYGHAGFDCCYHDGLRDAIRDALSAARGGMNNLVDVERIARGLWPQGLHQHWRTLQQIENHDRVHLREGDRIPTVAAGELTRSWWAVSRSRVANGLLLTAPGIPLIFMGQEFLEDKRWSDDPRWHPGNLIWWEGLDTGRDRVMVNFHHYMEQLIWLRRNQPALRHGRLNVHHKWNPTRVIAFHRWIEGSGQDVVVVASLNDQTFDSYELAWPSGGSWREIFNSEAYDDYEPRGNLGATQAWWAPRDGMPATARLVIPANSLLVFAR